MLSIIVLRRLDCVLEPTKGIVLKEYEKLIARDIPETAMERLLWQAADVFDYIEVFYNRQRRHSHLGGVSPEAFEQGSL